MSDSLEDYNKAKGIYDGLRRSHPELLEELGDLIDSYVEGRDEVNSTKAGRDILRKWPKRDDFIAQCGEHANQVFGIILKEQLGSDWTQESVLIRGRKQTIYRRIT